MAPGLICKPITITNAAQQPVKRGVVHFRH